ncbi:HAMP domain-containing histidine kinase [Cytobacillus oceanisediminis]|uniref:sensor histidine kinase n=1 Tax=Cytobacillus oceanisediminis TaxID=665099 RepID=UPI001CCA8288|nr:HAMP domain-containing sensor histidine kinase [Cytobacillus oceanisediminis]MBZ9533566.1 HAMP domain-containing histidine kinase [Cytobacillus oceanisediminis]
MLRNREVKILTTVLALISTVAIMYAIIAYSISVTIFLLIVIIIIFGCFYQFTRFRYKEIEKLSSYLQQISNGDKSLDIRDNVEGELSVLKNNIYKVTLMLSENSALLRQEKLKLTDAISDISHQLKTPLTSMVVMTDLLSDPHLKEGKRREFTNNLSIQLERMEWLVSSLLKLSKMDAGTILFKKEQVDVKKLLYKAVEPVLIPMDIKGQAFGIIGDEGVTYIGDFKWTVEAIINILKNCVEHTHEGGEIHIRFSENVLFTEIVIQDNGKGIAKKDVPYIFKRFYKGENASEDSIGIGLAMAYSIIKSQHGDIEVRSKVGEGTTFHIKFYKQVV